MIHDISRTKAAIISLWLEAVIYGAYAVLFGLCIYVLLSVKFTAKGVNMPLLGTASTMFALSTAHVVVGLVRAITAFVDDGNNASEYYAKVWLPSSVLQQALNITNNIVADGLVIYRCYIVWGSRWKVVVFPMLMLIGTTVCGYASVYLFSQGPAVLAQSDVAWGLAFFGMMLATNLLVMTLIASRIYWISRKTKALLESSGGHKYNYSLAIVLESGALYSATLLILLVLLSHKVVSGYIVHDVLAQIMGFVPTLMIVRVGLGVSTQAVGATPSNSYQLSVPVRARKVVNVDAAGSESAIFMQHPDV